MIRPIKLLVAAAIVVVAGCATAPKSQSDRNELDNDAFAALNKMTTRDPGLAPLISNSAGYIVFPSIKKGAVGVGGAFGRGVLFIDGRHAGYVKLSQASFGLQLGGQKITELIVFRDRFAIDQLRAGNSYEVTGNASAVIVKTGAAASARFDSGVAVFSLQEGAMYELSVAGQKLSYDAG